MKKLGSNGYGAIELILVVIIVMAVGGTGYYVYNQNISQQSTLIATENSKPEENETSIDIKSKTKEFNLDSKNVTFITPVGWLADGVGCIKDSAAYSSTEYLDSVAILPGEKLPTVYGNNEYFHINICVFGNKNDLSPKDWFDSGEPGGLGAGGGGHPSGSDLSLEDPISNNPAYYIKFVEAEHSYDEVRYVISSKGKIVEVSARTYQVDKNISGVGDFRKFEDEIKKLSESIVIN